MCYGDAGSAVRELKKQGLTQTEATACLDEVRDKVAVGELEPVEALEAIGLDDDFLMALQDAYC